MSRATVAWPWPCGTVPSSTETTPCRSTLIRTCSVEPDLPRFAVRSCTGVARPTYPMFVADGSTIVAMPMPIHSPLSRATACSLRSRS